MPVNTYKYHGPPSGVTLTTGQEFTLFDGKNYDLPDDNPWVQSMVRQRRLIEAPPQPQPKPTKPKKEKEEAKA